VKAVLLSVHVVAAIVLIGPITVAASVFPRYARLAVGSGAGAGDWAVAAAMHRISRGYAVPALAVPVFGIGVGSAMGVLTQRWVLVSIALTVVAGALLAAGIIPGQREALTTARRSGGGSATGGGNVWPGLRRLTLLTGGFSLIWVVVVVLMILRPGSTTGV
jgi:hypothetical protein